MPRKTRKKSRKKNLLSMIKRASTTLKKIEKLLSK